MARDIAAHEEQVGHHHAARLLRGALAPNGHHLREAAAFEPPDVSEATSLSRALVRVETPELLEDVVLGAVQRAELDMLIREWKSRDKLEAHGVTRRCRLLFHGPPGCGKTLTARALGNATGLPVYVVRFEAVVGAYLGQTALRLREIFRFVEMTEAVVLFDEIDALAKRRGNPLDVGELDRVVISLMQELEHTRPRGFVVASSNIPRLLDDALWRRFDLVLSFPLPSREQLRRFSARLAEGFELRVAHPKSSANLNKLKTFADVRQFIEMERRHHLLSSP
jgi:SpoVK/Ycf46/Vps4 family AAA+-type ATPase